MSGLYLFCSNWKHYQMALELLKLMIRSDVPLSADAVKLFVDNMTNDALVVRKVQPFLLFCLSFLCVGNEQVVRADRSVGSEWNLESTEATSRQTQVQPLASHCREVATLLQRLATRFQFIQTLQNNCNTSN